ncbi:MAG: AN1-type zinc finger domain-containing protein [Candidatus Hermodarchaeota archaeon]
MSNCYLCDVEIKDIPYRCKFCGMIFCNKHRLPENHECPFDLRKKNKNINSLDKTLYQDALDFINKDLTVGKVYDYVTTNQMSKSEAIEMLSYFLERNDNEEIRKISLRAFKILELRSDKTFRVLENCLLSDEDPNVVKTATEILSYLFPKKSKDLLNWINKQDKNLK